MCGSPKAPTTGSIPGWAGSRRRTFPAPASGRLSPGSSSISSPVSVTATASDTRTRSPPTRSAKCGPRRWRASSAATRTNQRGECAFDHLELGAFRVVVTPTGSAAVTSRVVTLTRGGEVRGIDVGLAPTPPKPQPRPVAAGTVPPSAAAFAALGSELQGQAATRPRGPMITSPRR